MTLPRHGENMSRAMILMMMTLRMAMRRMTVMVMGSGTLPILIHASRKSSGTDSEFTREETNTNSTSLQYLRAFPLFMYATKNSYIKAKTF